MKKISLEDSLGQPPAKKKMLAHETMELLWVLAGLIFGAGGIFLFWMAFHAPSYEVGAAFVVAAVLCLFIAYGCFGSFGKKEVSESAIGDDSEEFCAEERHWGLLTSGRDAYPDKVQGRPTNGN